MTKFEKVVVQVALAGLLAAAVIGMALGLLLVTPEVIK